MNTYTVKANDNLWSIAIDHGFKSEQDLLAVQENKDLFSSTKRNEYRIYPGDIIHIPTKKEAKFEADANGKRIFRIPSRKGFIRFKPHDVEGTPLSKFQFEAKFQDQTFKGDETTDNGDIEIELPKIEKDGKIQLIGEYLKETKNKRISADEKLSLTTIQMKLYTNADAPEQYDDYIIHINFDPNDNKEGQLQKLSNEGLYNGYIPNVDYEKSVGRVDNSCYPDDVWPEHQLSSMDNNGSNLLPIPAPINFQPQYYPVVWEMLRYERLFKISKNQLESLERELKSLKQNKQPYDATNSQYLQSEIDKEYYQYCFNYWFSEFSSLWHAHTTKDASADALIRLRSHVLVDEKLTEITEKWRSEFETETIKDEILDKRYPENDVKYIPQVKDIFTTFYSTQQAKDKLTTKIVSPPLTSKVRFSYQDDPETPIANSYVLYWRYDKADTNKIETGREEFYNNARIMMPIGIGKTDDQGYLVQSLPFDGYYTKRYMKIEDGKFSMHGGAIDEDGITYDYLQPFMARYANKSDFQRSLNGIKAPKGEWNTLFNNINSHLPEYSSRVYSRAGHTNYWAYSAYLDFKNSETYADQIKNLVELKDSHPIYYQNLRVSTTNHRFNYYSSGSEDTWGFMVYPPDGGFIQTQNLAKLGNEGKYVYKGAINAPEKQGDFIQLPCTLQEWERRLKVQNNQLKAAIESFQLHSSSYQNNISSLGRMDNLLDLYKKYPYEYEEKDAATSAMRDDLAGKVNDLTQAIQDVLNTPKEDKNKDLHDALSSMKQCKDTICELLQSEGFREQLSLYQNAYLNDEDDMSPYMSLDESWQSVFATIADALACLAMTPDADDVFQTLLKPVLDPLITSEMVTELINNGISDVTKEMADDHGDSIPINRQGDSVIETAVQLKVAMDKIYASAAKEEPEKSVLNEIFNHPLYTTAQWSKGQLNKWVNDMPGAPSILMVILESYSSFLVREAFANGATKGYHIRMMMMIMHGFGFFSDGGQLKESDILKILRSNETVRHSAKVKTLEAKLTLGNTAVEKRQDTLAKVEKRLATASPGEKVTLNGVKDRLEKRLNEEMEHVFDTQDEIDHKIEKQISREKGSIERVQTKRRGRNENNVDEFYQQADGRNARVYKSVLWGITVVGLVEDWNKLSRLFADPSVPSVDMDIVMAHYAKTMTDTAVACSSAVVLMNRWVSSESKLFKGGAFLKDNGKFIADHADRLAIVGSVISLYISSRELYETYNNKTLLEKTDQYLDIAANAVTTLGYLMVRGSFDKLFCPLISAYLIPGLGQLLLIAGVIIMLVQLGLNLYVMWQGYRFKRDAAVGYYFWEEFELVRKYGERYTSDDESKLGTNDEQAAYKALMDIYENSEQLGKNNTGNGWGHLSWRGAVPIFVSWRRMGIPESQLIKMIEFISKVPEIEGDISNHSSVLSNETLIERLLSPEAIVKFYLHLEETKQKNPAKEIYFVNGDTKLSYQAVMNQLEQGTYTPKGETDDVIDHLKGVDDIIVNHSSQFIILQTRYRNVVWDHAHFR